MSLLAVNPDNATIAAAGGQSTHALINAGGERLVFKSSNNNEYRVKPVFGFVDPGATTNLEITRLAGAAKNDKMVVHFATAPADAQDPAAVFAPAGQATIQISTHSATVLKSPLQFFFCDKKKITSLRGDIEVLEKDGVCFIRSKESKNAFKLIAVGDRYVCARRGSTNCSKSASLSRPVTNTEDVRTFIKSQVNKCVLKSVLLPHEDGYTEPPNRSTPKRSREVAPVVDCSAPLTLRTRVVVPK